MSDLAEELRAWAREPRPWPEELALERMQEDAVAQGSAEISLPTVVKPEKRARTSKKSRLDSLGIVLDPTDKTTMILSELRAAEERAEGDIVEKDYLDVRELRTIVTSTVRAEVDCVRATDPIALQTVIENTLRTVQALSENVRRRGEAYDEGRILQMARKVCVSNAEMLGLALKSSNPRPKADPLASVVSSIPSVDAAARRKERQLLTKLVTPRSTGPNEEANRPPLGASASSDAYVTPLVKQGRSN
jgi:hypothetical protein